MWPTSSTSTTRVLRCRRGRSSTQCVKAPAGIGAVQTFSNRHITVGLDGIVEMSEEDAACLIPAGWIKLPDGTATLLDAPGHRQSGPEVLRTRCQICAARDKWERGFESCSLQRRVCELSVPIEMRDRTGRSGLASVVAVRVSPASYATSCDVIL